MGNKNTGKREAKKPKQDKPKNKPAPREDYRLAAVRIVKPETEG